MQQIIIKNVNNKTIPNNKLLINKLELLCKFQIVTLIF